MIPPRLKFLWIAVLIGIAAFQFAKTLDRAWDAWGIDYDKHWLAYDRLSRGESPYTGEPPDNYPAVTKPLFVWLMLFDFHSGEKAWDIWNGLMLLASAALAAALYRPKRHCDHASRQSAAAQFQSLIRDTWWAWAVFLTLTFTPITYQFSVGNIAPSVFFLLVLWGGLEGRARDEITGLSLALASLIKLMTGFVLLPYLLARRWRSAAGFSAGMAVYLLGVTLAGWWAWEAHLFTVILPGFTWEFRGICYGVNTLLAETVCPWAYRDPATFRLFSTIVGAALIITSTAVLWLGRRRLGSPAGFQTGLIFALLSLIVINPMLEYHHYIWLMPAWLWFWGRWATGAMSHRQFAVQLPCWALVIGAAQWGDLTGLGFWPALAGSAALWIFHGWELLHANTTAGVPAS